ncbi:hypothetical protein [Collinsella aerofaciens]|uniref:hypothetical protein n=1 Tax=Collinsella aerofaciens TaxID=74426 RepID=UPI00321AC50F
MKKRDSIYEAFLSAIDEDLRGMCEVNRKAELPLPCPYCGEKNVERLAKSLVGVLEERSPDIPGLVPEQYRADVHEARELLTAATLALLSLYFSPRDSCMGSVAAVVSMFRHGCNAAFKSAGVLLFEQVTTGMKYNVKKDAYIPSPFVRHIDSKKPYDRLHRDGSRGFTADEDDVVMFFERYRVIQQRVFDTSPRFNFELCVKYPYEALSDNRQNFYYMEEKMEIDLATKVRGLQDRYLLNCAQAKGYDLLDKLMINALLAYLRDGSVSIAARESYVAQTERLIDGAVKLPCTTSPKEGVSVDRIS